MKTLLLAVASIALVACSKSDAPAPSGGSTTASTAKGPAAAAGAKVINITKLGLKGSAPGETEEPIIGTGDPVMIAAAFFTVNVSEAKATDPKKVKDGEAVAKAFNPKNLKSETLPDGWVITFMNTGSAGDNYWVSVRREIGGKGYLCETTQSTVDQQNKAVAFCKSLTKA